MIARDVVFEHQLLADLHCRAMRYGFRHPAPGHFVAGVIARLDQHGPGIEPRPVGEYLAEIREEALDIAAWSLVARQAHPLDIRAQMLGEQVSLYGYGAHSLLADLELDAP